MDGNSKYAVNLLQPSMAGMGGNSKCAVNTTVLSESKTGSVTEIQRKSHERNNLNVIF